MSNKTTELAWAAGFFDGEGWTSMQKNGHMIVGCSQKDIRPAERFLAAVEIGAISHLSSGMHTWQTSGVKAKQVMKILWPYLSEPKKEQYKRVLEASEKILNDRIDNPKTSRTLYPSRDISGKFIKGA